MSHRFGLSGASSAAVLALAVAQAVLAQFVDPVRAYQDGHVLPGVGQPGADEAADRAGPGDQESHLCPSLRPAAIPVDEPTDPGPPGESPGSGEDSSPVRRPGYIRQQA